MQVVLNMFGADGEKKPFKISRDMTVIGRREDCDVRIPLSDVSRKHCRLVKEGDSVRIEDLGSSNGTFRNGERVQESAVEAGDTIRVGPVNFVVQIDGVPGDDELHVHQDAAAVEMEGEMGEAESGESPTVAEEAPTEDFDPMAALAGSDSGLEMDTPPPGDSSMQIDLGGSSAGENA